MMTDFATTSTPIFYLEADEYLYPMDAGISEPSGQDCYLPLEVDTEYYHPPIDFNSVHPGNLSPTITVQVRAVGVERGFIFGHPDCERLARHYPFESEFIVVDYLRVLGHQAELRQADSNFPANIPTLQIELFAYFAVAEMARIVRGQYRDDILSACLNAEKQGRGIVQGRRLRTFTRIQGRYNTHLRMPWILNLNGRDYGINLVIHDTCAVHGSTGYAGFCQNTGVELLYKDNFTPSEKSDMFRMSIDRPDDFDNYALGDLYNYEALTKNIALFKNIYEAVGLQDYVRLPRLTTGATVRDLIESSIARIMRNIHPESSSREIINAYCKYGTSDHIKKLTSSTAAYNAKVDGGRCRNNRPTDTVVHGSIYDMDIDSCYGTGLRLQLYPIGIPIILDYPLESEINTYLTLRDFLDRYGKELIPGLWQARVSTLNEYSLNYPQDFLMSWFPPKDIRNLPSDNDFVETEEWWNLDNVGLLKIFTHQVNLALINHDFVQWLDNVASVRQRKELLDNLYVHTAMYYPASDRVDSPEKLRHRHDTHDGRNTCTIKKVRGKTTKISIQQECHAWYGMTMGDMFIDKLLIERRKYAKNTPLNQLYKLSVNTAFGDMVSPYFTVGNVVVGNNITARARALAWCMEKGYDGHQTITDGCQFDINKVVYPKGRHRVNGETVVGLHRVNSREAHLEFKPLAVDIDTQSIADSAWQHLQSLFPGLDILHADTIDIEGNPRKGQFKLEVKGVYDSAVFHGSANYAFFKSNQLVEIKMRSYSKKPHESLILPEGSKPVIDNNEYHPAKVFLKSLLVDSTRVPRQPSYLKQSILKVADFARHYDHKYDGSKVFPGMTIKQSALLREFSLAQFTFQNLEQYRSWEREVEQLRRQYGQSYEMFFLNADGSLNYQAMVNVIDSKIANGHKSFWNDGERRKQHIYRQQSPHPSLECLDATKESLKTYYCFKDGLAVGDDDRHGEDN